ncbi:MAG: methyltransferase [Proteobacteria bacterium]|nr:methyltransferase [Pseudomonadota bacterium]
MAAIRKSALKPDRLMQLGTGFWASRTFLSAVELGLFTHLAKGAQKEEALRAALGLHARSARDFFDALVAMGVLRRRRGLYANTPETDLFLDRNKPTYIGGILEMMASRLYGFWGALTQGLRTGEPQNEIRRGEDLFGALYADPQRLRGFLSAMTGISLGAARAIARKFPWKRYRSFCDVGGAQGAVGVQLALAHAHLAGSEFDLPAVQPIYEEYVRRFGLQGRLTFTGGDFFRDPLPSADVLIMGHVLHDWDLQQKHLLLQKAYSALPKNGALIVYEAMIDNDRSRNLPGLLMSLNMLIETPGGFDFTIRDCRQWLKTVGFRRTQAIALPGPDTMVIGYRS